MGEPGGCVARALPAAGEPISAAVGAAQLPDAAAPRTLAWSRAGVAGADSMKGAR